MVLQVGVTSCTKEVIHDTTLQIKHDTTIKIIRDTIIHNDTALVIAKDTVFSMDVNSWNLFDYVSHTNLAPGPTTYLNTSEGIKFFAQGYRIGSRLQIKSEVGFKDKTIYYKWKVNGAGAFCAYAVQIKYNPTTNDGTPAIEGEDLVIFSVQNTSGGTYPLIQDNVWYYTSVKPILGTDNFNIITATGDYDNKGGSVFFSKIVPIYTKHGYMAIRIGDPFSSSGYCILGECKIASN
ncbi:MAG: hypothetical protein NVS9B7_22520 [Flavisolibacter sp.]